MITLFVLVFLHTSIEYYDQQKIPIRKGMTGEQVENILGQSQQTIPQGRYAKVAGVTFASFKIANICQVFQYKDGVLYVYFDKEGRVKHTFKGKT
jgi:outer membrane protein assembly factor BamE (lipoprotein component of BamABCDE complex)